MKILIDARLYGLHHRGIGRYLIELIRGLTEKYDGHDYVLLIDPTSQDHFPSLPSYITTVHAPYKVYSLAEQINLPRLIKKISPDLVHWTHFSAPFFCPAPYVITIHDLILHHVPTERASRLPGIIYWLKILAYRILLNRLVKKAKVIMTVSQTVADDLVSYYPSVKPKVRVIHLAPSLLPAAKINQRPKPYLLVVGAAYPHKNLERVIEAVNLVRQKEPTLELKLVGRLDFFSHKLKIWVKNKGYDKWVFFLPHVTDAELAGLYKNCQAYLLLSLQEGFGLGSVEAAAAGSAVVASDIPVLHEIMADGAIYAKPDDIEDMAQAILKTMDQSTKEKLLSQAQQIIKKYSWPLTVNKIRQVYNKAIED